MRRGAAILVSSLVVAVMAIGVWRYVRPLEGPEELVLSQVQGDVALDGPGRIGLPEAGQRIRAADHLTTRDGRATLELEGGTRVRVGPASSVLILGVDETGVELELEGGAVKATVRPESGSVAVTGAGVTAQATDAEFAFGVQDDLTVLESERGVVAVMGAEISRVREGERAVIRQRAAAVGPIPEDLLLSVAWPEQRRTRSDLGTVRGHTLAGARVVVEGAFGRRVVHADQDGTFEVQIPLGEGENPVNIEATDVFGETTEVRGILQTRDTSPPKLRAGVEYDR